FRRVLFRSSAPASPPATTPVPMSCTGPQICCRSGPNDNPNYACVSGAAACTGTNATPIACNDASDCGTGQVCCGAVNNGRVVSAVCAAAGSCTGNNALQLCDPAGGVVCTAPQVCRLSTQT